LAWPTAYVTELRLPSLPAPGLETVMSTTATDSQSCERERALLTTEPSLSLPLTVTTNAV